MIMEEQNRLLSKSFFWMFLGILATAIVSYYTYTSGLLVDLLSGNMFLILLIAELVVVLLFRFLFRKLPYQIVALLYFLYSVINGLFFSTLFAEFELGSIVYIFLATSLAFAILSFIGATTKKDLSSFGTLITPFLLIGIILSLVNLFILHSSMLDIILSWVILIVFLGITVYDVNRIKQLEGTDYANSEKLYVYFAMELYLDFINIFIRLLELFGDRSSD